LLAAFRVLDAERERLTGDADRFEGECGQCASASGGDDLRGDGRCREEPGVVVLEGDTAETTRRVDRVEDVDARPGVVALREVEPDAVGPPRLHHKRVDPPGVRHEIRLTTQEPACAATTDLP